MHLVISFLCLVQLLLSSARADHDWSAPCHQGVCSYDIPPTQKSMGATVLLSGPPNAISDLTTASGWEILSCSPGLEQQEIRIVCTGNTTSCDHLFLDGAEDTVVRLPPRCGNVPFARVVYVERSPDQSLPFWLKKELAKHSGRFPEVMAVTIDTDFSSTRDVHYLVVSSSSPKAIKEVDHLVRSWSPSRSKRHTENLLRKIDAELKARTIGEENFQLSSAIDLVPIQISPVINVFQQSLSCPAGAGSVLLQATVTLDFDVTYHITTSGELALDDFNQFIITAVVNTGEIFGHLELSTQHTAGTFSGSSNTPFAVSRALSVAGIFTVTPSFNLGITANGQFASHVDMSANFGYNINSMSVTFPTFSGSHSASVTPNAPSLGVDPSMTQNAVFSYTFTPMFNFALSGGSGFGTSEVTFGSTSTGTLTSTVSGGQVCSTLQEQLTISTGLQGNFFNIFDPGASSNIVLVTNSSSTQSCSTAARKRSIDTLSSSDDIMPDWNAAAHKRQTSISCAA